MASIGMTFSARISGAFAAAAVAAGLFASAAQGAEMLCPSAHDGRPLKSIDVLDGPLEEEAFLVPDENEIGKHGRRVSWSLAYVYDAGRKATVLCNYSGGGKVAVTLEQRVSECRYSDDEDAPLQLFCE